MNVINVTSPKTFQEIGAEFNLIGSVLKSHLITEHGLIDMRLFTDYLDIDGKNFKGGTIRVRNFSRFFNFFHKRNIFYQVENFSWINVSSIEKSQGRITLKISGHDKKDSIYIPLIVKQFVPAEGSSDEIIKKHGRVGEMVEQYQRDLDIYYKELNKIEILRKIKGANTEYIYGENAHVAYDIYKILEDSEEKFVEYEFNEEDRLEKELEEKYRDAIEWRGPLLRGTVSQFAGFDLTVHSHDHGKHFHIIHRGKKINARFSFPEMKLIGYVTQQNTISSKQERKIREYCLKPEIFKKFEREFQKRERK